MGANPDQRAVCVVARRYTQLVMDFKDVTYIILDEMSMVGRRALGQEGPLSPHPPTRPPARLWAAPAP